MLTKELAGIQLSQKSSEKQKWKPIGTGSPPQIYEGPKKEVEKWSSRGWYLCVYVKIEGGSVAEWLEFWTQAQKGRGSNRSHDSSRIRTERVYTGPHRVGPNRPGWVRSISALKLLNILRDVTTNMAEQQRIFN